ncbi:hypothetical protein NO2_0321 [Candidatus Termititenax persephonae]|uniref:N-acetyltransferase domain-containing protein n=1 Tax=Candidatus Termititenax persephonae TaxID=2218525 RepID=A0A388TGB0_9BACT|nr:hypothetical protein NO2_0321 [Candidatus Termititenax persephonae]
MSYNIKALETGDKYEFDCGDSDLNEFFHKDALPHKRDLIGVTYFMYEEGKDTAAAFFTVMNDVVKTAKLRNDEVVAQKLYKFYPAVKIGRFGVDKKYQRQRIGVKVMNSIKYLFTYENKTGCRFLTLDAYNKLEVLAFYQKCGFTFFTNDADRRTRAMKYDLKFYSDELNVRLQATGGSTYSNR